MLNLPVLSCVCVGKREGGETFGLVDGLEEQKGHFPPQTDQICAVTHTPAVWRVIKTHVGTLFKACCSIQMD